MKPVCNHPEHQAPWLSDEGWIVTGDEAWTAEEWERHAWRVRYDASEARKRRDAARHRRNAA